MRLGRPAKVDDPLPEERNEVSSAYGGFHLFAKRDVAVVDGVRLGPPHQTLDFARIEWRSNGAG